LFNYLNWMVDNTRKYVYFHRAVAELNTLSDEELNDIGLTRGEIITTVYKTVCNK